MSVVSLPTNCFAPAPIMSRRFPGVLFSHTDLEAYLRKASVSRTLDCSGALLNNIQDTTFISNFISTQQLTFELMNFGCCQLTPECLESLLAKELSGLRALIIRDNNLKKAAGYVIAKLLGSRGQMTIVDLQNNSLGDVGVSSIAGGFTSELIDTKLRAPHALLTLSKLSLQELDLSGNDISDLGVIALCSGLGVFVRNAYKANQKIFLKILRLSRNRITDKGASALARLIDLGCLSEMERDRKDNFIPITADRNLPLLLEELCLSDNLITSVGVSTILKAASGFTENGIYGLESTVTNPSQNSVKENDNNHSPSAPIRTIELRKLEFARCLLTLDALSALSSYLSSSPKNLSTSKNIQIDFQFTEKQASLLLKIAAQKYENSEFENDVCENNAYVLTTVLKQLAFAVNSDKGITRVLLGALPNTLRRWSLQSCESKGKNWDNEREHSDWSIGRSLSNQSLISEVPFMSDHFKRDVNSALDVLYTMRHVLEVPSTNNNWILDANGGIVPIQSTESEVTNGRKSIQVSRTLSRNGSFDGLKNHGRDVLHPVSVRDLNVSTGKREEDWDTTWDHSFEYISTTKSTSPPGRARNDKEGIQCGSIESTDGSVSTSLLQIDALTLMAEYRNSQGYNRYNLNRPGNSSLTSSLQTSPMTPPSRSKGLSTCSDGPHLGGILIETLGRSNSKDNSPFSPSSSSVFMTELPDDTGGYDSDILSISRDGDAHLTCNANVSKRNDDSEIASFIGVELNSQDGNRRYGYSEYIVDVRNGENVREGREAINRERERHTNDVLMNSALEKPEKYWTNEKNSSRPISRSNSMISTESTQKTRQPFKRERSRERIAQQLTIGRPSITLVSDMTTEKIPDSVGTLGVIPGEINSERSTVCDLGEVEVKGKGRQRIERVNDKSVRRNSFDKVSPEQSDLLQTLIGELARIEDTSRAEGPKTRVRPWPLIAVDTSDVSVSTTRSAWDQVSPSFPRDRTGTSSSTTSASADGDMQSLVQKAVDEALDKAQRQWLSALAPVLLSMRSGSHSGSQSAKEPRTNSRSPGPKGPNTSLNRSSSISRGNSSSTIEGSRSGSDMMGEGMVHEREVFLEPFSMTRADLKLKLESIQPSPMKVKNRRTFVEECDEDNLSVNGGVRVQHRNTGKDMGRGRDKGKENYASFSEDHDIEERKLSARLAAIESDIEFEHEASIQVLDALMCQHFKLTQQHKDRERERDMGKGKDRERDGVDKKDKKELSRDSLQHTDSHQNTLIKTNRNRNDNDTGSRGQGRGQGQDLSASVSSSNNGNSHKSMNQGQAQGQRDSRGNSERGSPATSIHSDIPHERNGQRERERGERGERGYSTRNSALSDSDTDRKRFQSSRSNTPEGKNGTPLFRGNCSRESGDIDHREIDRDQEIDRYRDRDRDDEVSVQSVRSSNTVRQSSRTPTSEIRVRSSDAGPASHLNNGNNSNSDENSSINNSSSSLRNGNKHRYRISSSPVNASNISNSMDRHRNVYMGGSGNRAVAVNMSMIMGNGMGMGSDSKHTLQSAYIRPTRSSLIKAAHQQTLYRDMKSSRDRCREGDRDKDREREREKERERMMERGRENYRDRVTTDRISDSRAREYRASKDWDIGSVGSRSGASIRNSPVGTSGGQSNFNRTSVSREREREREKERRVSERGGDRERNSVRGGNMEHIPQMT